MKTLFLVSAVFFIAALGVQFQHEFFLTEEAKRVRVIKIDSQLLDDSSSPVGQRSREEAIARLTQVKAWAEARLRGEKTPGDIVLEKEIAEEKKAQLPICLFLYGAGTLFLFGGFMKRGNSEHINKAS